MSDVIIFTFRICSQDIKEIKDSRRIGCDFVIISFWFFVISTINSKQLRIMISQDGGGSVPVPV